MKGRLRKSFGLLIGIFMLFGSITVRADEKVQISDKEYLINLQSARAMFISNDKAVSGKVGSKVFLTYTVDKVISADPYQMGVIGTTDNTQDYPYLKDGRMDYDTVNIFEEGYTYVYRFERTEDGFTYSCAKMKGDEAVNLNFTNVAKAGDTDAYKYYGVWVDCEEKGISAILNHVRCYDEKGNDLGIHFNRPTGVIQNEANKVLDVHLTVNTSYDITFDEVETIAISNKYATDSNVVYMEYEVADVSFNNTIQQGTIMTRVPLDTIPHGTNGQLYHKTVEEGQGAKELPLLREGAKYFICFVKGEETFSATVQCTQNGETETLSFPYPYGNYDPSYKYFCLWFGEGPEYGFGATFKNFKCYDAEGNSLGVQTRRKDIQIIPRGETEDYSKSQAVYYCKANDTILVLEDGKKAIKQVGTIKEEGTYRILNRNELYLELEDGKEAYTYHSTIIRDTEGNEYLRARTTTVTFVAGEEKQVVDVNAASGFRVQVPEEPKKEGTTFKGWYYSDGTAFDFETILTESITLYAKWQDGDGNEYLETDIGIGSIDNAMMIAIVASVVIVAACTIGCVTIIKRRKR